MTTQAPPEPTEAAQAALRDLQIDIGWKVMQWGQVTFLNDGGVQVEWLCGGIDAQVSFKPTGGGHVIYTDLESGEEYEGDLQDYLPQLKALLEERLVKWLMRLC